MRAEYLSALSFCSLLTLGFASPTLAPRQLPIEKTCTLDKAEKCHSKCKCGAQLRAEFTPEQIIDEPTVSSQNECGNYCFADSSCQSFGYDPSNNGCALYTIKVQGPKYTDDSSGIVTYDRQCFKCSGNPPDASCGNQGLQFAIYSGEGVNSDNIYTPEDFKSMSPAETGVTSAIGGFHTIKAKPVSIYGSSTQVTSYYAVNHRGYMYAPMTGTYKFLFHHVDDLAELWVGDLAYSGWDDSNSDSKAQSTPGPPVVQGRRSKSIQLEGAKTYPIRIFFSNANRGGGFSSSIKAPDGTTIMDTSGFVSEYVIQYSCDGTTLPPYPDFGSET